MPGGHPGQDGRQVYHQIPTTLPVAVSRSGDRYFTGCSGDRYFTGQVPCLHAVRSVLGQDKDLYVLKAVALSVVIMNKLVWP